MLLPSGQVCIVEETNLNLNVTPFNFNFLHCLGLIDVLSANQDAYILNISSAHETNLCFGMLRAMLFGFSRHPDCACLLRKQKLYAGYLLRSLFPSTRDHFVSKHDGRGTKSNLYSKQLQLPDDGRKAKL